MASKWNAVPLTVLPGLTFLAARLYAGRRRPVRSVSDLKDLAQKDRALLRVFRRGHYQFIVLKRQR